MKIQDACKECVLDQAARVGTLLNLSSPQKEAVLRLARFHAAKFDMKLSPPMNAYPLYEDIARYLGVFDIYGDVKKTSSLKAKEFVPECEARIKTAADPLLAATKIAIAGNVIDLASSMQYDLKDELEKVLETPFEIDDFEALRDALRRAKNIVYLADNAGEEIFDKLFIKLLQERFGVKIYYFTRGRPIINDITYSDALASKMDEVCDVIDSGVPTPGFVLELADTKAAELFKEASLVIAKGMGNYECLSEYGGFEIFYLFKVKCEVVGKAVNATLGSLVCKKA